MTGVAERERYMGMALEQAQAATRCNEVPVGAVLIRDRDGEVLAKAHNHCEQTGDATAHAELICIQKATPALAGRLTGCTLYVTMEPCAMCAGAAVNAKLTRLVFGAFDERAGCCGSVFDLTDHCFYHTVEVWGGILEKECAALLTDFFQHRRQQRP